MSNARSHNKDTGELPSLLRKLMVISNLLKPQGLPNKPFRPQLKILVTAQTQSDSLSLPLPLSCRRFCFVVRLSSLRIMKILLLQHPKSWDHRHDTLCLACWKCFQTNSRQGRISSLWSLAWPSVLTNSSQAESTEPMHSLPSDIRWRLKTTQSSWWNSPVGKWNIHYR